MLLANPRTTFEDSVEIFGTSRRLPRFAQDATGRYMGRILSALLILVLALSHGPMGAAVPHLDGSTHEHVRAVDADHHDHHNDDPAAVDAQSAQTDAAPDRSNDLDKATQGSGYHTHVAADGVPGSSISLLASASDKVRRQPLDDARLRSTTLEPLPEPPSA